MKLGKPVNMFLGPITTECLHCSSTLHINHEPINVVVYTLHGPVPGQKIILRCKFCSINYRYDSFGGDSLGGYRSVLYGTCNGINCCVNTDFMTIKGI